MATLVPDKSHPALEVPEVERVAYLTVVAIMVHVDQSIDDRELARVRSLGRTLAVPETEVERIIGGIGEHKGEVAAHLDTLRTSELRFALMVDALDIAYADDEIVPDEATELRLLARSLDISDSQLAMLRRYVESRTGREDTAATEAANEQLKAGLAGAGVPVAALAVATGLGAPLLAGVGVAAALGVGSYQAVKWLLRRRRDG